MIGRRLIGMKKIEDETGLFFDAAFLTVGVLSGDSSYTTQSIITDAYCGTAGLRLTGRPLRLYSYDWAVRYAEIAKWEIEIDLAPYRYLRFSARKVVNYGCIMVTLDGVNPEYDAKNGLLWVKYSEASTDWTGYTIDIAERQNTQLLAFMGGYVDRSGPLTSETQYANIRLVI